ncbi:MAG: GNAT family N-acetyltransferase [Sphingobacteriales bacterium]
MKTYLIRRIKETEINDLMLLIEEHTAYEKAEYSSKGKKERLSAELFKENCPLKCWIVEIDNVINGFCSYTIDYSTWDAASFLNMDCLYIRESFRGLGIGSAIIKKLTLIAKENSCVNLQWQTPVFNAPAIAFYKKAGAVAREKVRFSLATDL